MIPYCYHRPKYSVGYRQWEQQKLRQTRALPTPIGILQLEKMTKKNKKPKSMKQNNKPRSPTHLHVPDPFTPLLSLYRLQLCCSASQASGESLIHKQYKTNIYWATTSRYSSSKTKI